MNTPQQTGNIIRQLRKDLGLSQAQLAEKLKVQNTTVSRWETGDGYPDISILLELTKVLNIKIGDLLDSPDHQSYLDHSVRSLYAFKNPLTTIAVQSLKIMVALLPISLHIILYYFSSKSTYITIGVSSLVPFLLKLSVLLFMAIIISYDRALYKILFSFINKHIVRLDNGQLAPDMKFLISIEILLVTLSLFFIV